MVRTFKTVICIIILAPIAWLGYLSLGFGGAYYAPAHPLGRLAGWVEFMQSGGASALMNSSMLAVGSAFASTALGLVTAVALIFPGILSPFGRTSVGNFLVFSRVFPAVVIIPGVMAVLRPFGAVDTLWVLLLLYIPAMGVIPTMVFSVALSGITMAEIELMSVEGWPASAVYRWAIWPLVQDSVPLAMMLCFCLSWNEFVLQNAVLDTSGSQTVSIFVAGAIGQFSINYPLMAAGALVSLLPPAVAGAIIVGKTLSSRS